MNDDELQQLRQIALWYPGYADAFKKFGKFLANLKDEVGTLSVTAESPNRIDFEFVGHQFSLTWKQMLSKKFARLILFERNILDADRYDEVSSVIFDRQGNAAPDAREFPDQTNLSLTTRPFETLLYLLKTLK